MIWWGVCGNRSEKTRLSCWQTRVEGRRKMFCKNTRYSTSNLQFVFDQNTTWKRCSLRIHNRVNLNHPIISKTVFTHNFQMKLLCTIRFWSFALSGVQVSNIPIIGCCIFSSICLAEWPMTNREMAPQLGYKGASGNLNTMPLQGNPNPNNVIRIEYEVPLVGHDCDYKANTTRSSFLLSTTTICFGFLPVFFAPLLLQGCLREAKARFFILFFS